MDPPCILIDFSHDRQKRNLFIIFQHRKYESFPSMCTITVADLGFPRGGCANPKGRGRQPTICLIFPKNCMKMKKFWPRGGRVPGALP